MQAPFFYRWSWAVQKSALSVTARRVAWPLVTHANKDGRCWPTQETLRRLAGYRSRSSVVAGLAELDRHGFICRDPGYFGGGFGRATIYQLTIGPVTYDQRTGRQVFREEENPRTDVDGW